MNIGQSFRRVICFDFFFLIPKKSPYISFLYDHSHWKSKLTCLEVLCKNTRFSKMLHTQHSQTSSTGLQRSYLFAKSVHTRKKKKITNSFYFKATSSCVLQVHFASRAAEDLQMFPFEVCQRLESVSIHFTWMILFIFKASSILFLVCFK